MSVVYNGVGAHFRPMTREERAPVLARYGLSGRYIFTAARFEKCKNWRVCSRRSRGIAATSIPTAAWP